MSDEDAKKMLARIRDIMEETGLPFGPATNKYIEETYGPAPLDIPILETDRRTDEPNEQSP